jgi:dTDP-4-amino-4,6-dideoxygalactose transaminase
MIPAAKPIIGDEEREAVDRVLRSGMLAQGPEVKAFEEEFSAHVGGRHCVAMNSGTSALHLGFIAAGIERGDEVIVPSFSFVATANSVVLAGGVPVFADIDPKTFNMYPDHVESLITKKTKAIMPVHLYGHIAAMDRFQEISSKHGIKIIEDAAQGHLASMNGRNAGEFGVVASFSFYPTKNMTAGEGGMVVTDSADVARTLRLLRNQGQEIRYQNEIIGFNTRMTDIHAAIGRVQLAKLPGWTKTRQENAAYLDANLKGVFRMSRAVMRTMMKQRYGRIINITSVVGASGNPGQANYAAAKAGVAGMTRALARELGSRQITVNCVAPGFIATDMTAALSQEQQNALLGQIPLGHLGQVADVAHAVVYLASPQAGYVTGQELHVNGGMHM